jgi:uncharacterized protein (DUF2267 family)
MKHENTVKLQITLVMDHGNRDGFDHLDMLVLVLLDILTWILIDAAAAAAAAIHHLLKALCVDEYDDDAEFSDIDMQRFWWRSKSSKSLAGASRS